VLPIDPAVFATSSGKGTIIDSGTTLAYLAEAAYDPFVNAVCFLSKLSVFNQSIWNDILVLYGKYFEVFFFQE